MEDAFRIRGGKELHGTITLSGAKNIALKVIIASLLFDSQVVLENIPRISDIEELIHLLRQIGVTIEHSENSVTISPQSLTLNKVDMLHASKIRVSFLLFAPLLYRFGSATIPNPGGCRLGARSIDRIVDGLKAVGVDVSYDSSTGYYNATMKDHPQGYYRFEKPSHTGTELMIMMSVFAKGTILLQNVAQEPEIDDLIAMLCEGGADIRRKDKTVIINGVSKLTQKKPFAISNDRVEAATYAVLALASGGEVTVSSIQKHYLSAFNSLLVKAGARVEELPGNSWKYSSGKLTHVSIETAPHPGILTDWQPLLAVLLTQAQGISEIHERIFESRFRYVEELRKLGAHIAYVEKKIDNPSEHYHFHYDPKKEYHQTIQITGPQELHGGVVTVSDLRAGATLAIAALIAKNESYVKGVSHIKRGYEQFVSKIKSLGGDIEEL